MGFMSKFTETTPRGRKTKEFFCSFFFSGDSKAETEQSALDILNRFGNSGKSVLGTAYENADIGGI